MKGKLIKTKEGWVIYEDSSYDSFGQPCVGGKWKLHPNYILDADIMYPDSLNMEIGFNVEDEYAVPFRDSFYLTNPLTTPLNTQMIERLREHLNSIIPEQFQEEIKEIEDEGFVNTTSIGEFICNMPDCPHCAYEQQQQYEEDIEKEAAIDFAKWIAKDFMSIWVEDKWMWECINEQSELYTKYAYLTEEQLYELYLKSK